MSSILQDSLEDWEREAKSMGSVYTNAICNIAACDGHDSSHSLFPSRCQPNQRITVQSQFREGPATFNVVPDWVRLTRNYAPLYKRAWVVQERFLSTRLMHFTKIPIWECRNGLRTPTYRQGTTSQPDYSDFLGSEKGWLLSSQQDVKFAFARWLRVVELYSNCGLTRHDDKLVAISGLAQSFSVLLNEHYYAGIWGGNFLIPSLLWTPDGERGMYSQSKYLGIFHFHPTKPAHANPRQHPPGLGLVFAVMYK